MLQWWFGCAQLLLLWQGCFEPLRMRFRGTGPVSLFGNALLCLSFHEYFIRVTYPCFHVLNSPCPAYYLLHTSKIQVAAQLGAKTVLRRLWPTLAKTKFGQTKIGQNQVWPNEVGPEQSLAKQSLGRQCLARRRLTKTFLAKLACALAVSRIVALHPNPPPHPPTTRRVRVGPRLPDCSHPPRPPVPNPDLRWTALRRTAQICALCFPPPATIFILSSLAWGSSRGIFVVFLKAGTLKCARLESESPNVHV